MKLRIPHRNLILTALGIAAVVAVLEVTRFNLATVISVSTVLGAVPVAIGFASQGYLSNLIAGRALQAEGRIRIGARIATGDYTGIVTDIQLRTVELYQEDGSTVVVPATTLFTSPFVVLPKEH